MGTFPYRFSPDTRKLFQEHEGFFSGLVPAMQGSGLNLYVADEEAGSELTVLPGGQLTVTFTYPLDDDREASNGRIYLKDHFIFRGKEEKIREFKREFVFNQKGADPALWQARLQQFSELELPGRQAVQGFAQKVARTCARPLSEETLAGLRGQGDYLGRAAQPFLEKFPDWKFRIKDPQNHFNAIPRGDRLEIVLSLVVDDNKNPPDGRIFLKESFLIDPATGRVFEHKRSFAVAPEVKGPLAEDLKNQVAEFNRRIDFQEDEAKVFFRALQPSLLKPFQSTLSPAEYLDYHVEKGVANWSPPTSGGSFGARAVKIRRLEEQRKAARDEAAQLLSLLEQERPIPPQDPLRRQIDQIAAEIDPSLRAGLYLNFARETLWKKYGRVRGAFALARRLQDNPEFKAGAERLSDELQGAGPWGMQFETFASRLSEDSTSTVLLAGMVGAAFGGTLAESLALRAVGKGGKGGRWLAGLIGLGGEAGTLTAISQVAGHGGGDSTQAFFSNLLFLGAIRLVHNSGAWATARMGEGRLGPRWGGVASDRSGNPILLSPMGRAALGEWGWALNGPTAQLTPAGKFLSGLMTHGGAVSAIAGSQALAKELGWLPGRSQGFFGEGSGALFGYLHGLAGFQLANQLSGGGLAAFLAEARLRMTGLQNEAPKGPAVPLTIKPASTSWKKLEPIASKDLPDVRIYETGKGEEFPFHIGAEGSIYLDPILLLRRDQTLEVKRDVEGQFFLRDHRELWSPAAGPEMTARPMDLAVMPLLLNKAAVPAAQDIPLQAGDELNFAGRRLRFSFPKKSPLGAAFSMAPRETQLRVSELMGRVEDLADLLQELRGAPFEGAETLHAQLSEVLAGRQLLFQLPAEWGIHSKITALLEKEIGRLEREGYPPSEFTLKPALQNPRWSDLEKNYQSARALQDWRDKLAQIGSPEELRAFFEQGPFSAIEEANMTDILEILGMAFGKSLTKSDGVPVFQTIDRPPEWVKQTNDVPTLFPVAGALRQKVLDLIEQQKHEAYWKARQEGTLPLPADPKLRREFIRLENARSSLFQAVRRLAESEGAFQGLDADELEELVYQVLERGRPLALLPQAKNIRHDVEFFQTQLIRVAELYYPQAMTAKVNPYTAEKIHPGQKEALYRLALHTLNGPAGRLLFGPPSLRERQNFAELVRRYLKDDLPEDYFRARHMLRYHLDRLTTQAKEMLLKVGLEEKAMILENYFGESRIRELPPAVAFQVASLLGLAGMYRELGVTIELRGMRFKGVLSLGDLHSVDKQDEKEFSLLHTHSEEYLTPDGKTMGMGGMVGGTFAGSGPSTLAMKPAKRNLETRNVLPSGEDLRIYLNQAKAYFKLRTPLKLFAIPFYDKTTRTFKTWVVHPLGISETRIQLDENGGVRKAELRFAFRGRDRHRDRSYLLQQEDLEKTGRELGIPTEVKEIPFTELVGELPFPAQFLL